MRSAGAAGTAELADSSAAALVRADSGAPPPCAAAGLSHVRRSLREEFGGTMAQLFSWLDAAPLASASVAQVPRGHAARSYPRPRLISP